MPQKIYELTKKTHGFTLIELLVVVAAIGILAGVSVSIMDVNKKKSVAEDGVKISNLEKLVQGIEAYNAGEGSYPTDTNGDGNPLNDSNTVLSSYINSWPVTGTSNYYYARIVEGSITFVCVSVPMSSNTAKNFKYVYPYDASGTGGKSECAGRVLKDCSTACSGGSSGNNIGDCSTLDNILCT